MLLLLSGCWVSCGSDEPETTDKTGDSLIDGNGTPNGAAIDEIVSNHTYVNSSYSDYTFTFVISSSIRRELPSAAVDYAIGHGSAYSSSTSELVVSPGAQAYYYSITSNDKTDVVTFRNPFWLYYAFVADDTEKLAMCEMYYNTYIALKRKGYGSLTADEKALYGEVTDYLDRCQQEAKSSYRPGVYVIINNKCHNIKTYQIP